MGDTAKQKCIEWARRYLPAELVSVILTLIAAKIAFDATRSNMTSALVATWIGSGVYYVFILAVDIHAARSRLHAQGLRYTRLTFMQNVRALLVEFGVAELVDLFLIRPAVM
jgi:hypothetical protein